jgi:hypothetical protein
MEDAINIPLPPGDEDFDGPHMAAGDQPQNGQQQQFFQPNGGQWGFFPPQQPFQQWFQPGPWMAAPPAAPGPPAKIKLTPFWVKDAAAWFELAESTFNRLNAHGSLLRYEYVLMALPEDVLEKVRSIMQVARAAADPYQLLKGRLVELFTPSVMEQLNGIIWQPELGGRRPSEMMEAMLALLPPGEQPGLLFKAHFIHRLPVEMRERVALGLQGTEPRALAALADELYHVRNSRQPVAAVAAAPDDKGDFTMEQLVAAMAGAKFKGKPAWRRKKQSGEANSKADDGGHTLCYSHKKYGEKAYNCKEPTTCTWKQSGN